MQIIFFVSFLDFLANLAVKLEPKQNECINFESYINKVYKKYASHGAVVIKLSQELETKTKQTINSMTIQPIKSTFTGKDGVYKQSYISMKKIKVSKWINLNKK